MIGLLFWIAVAQPSPAKVMPLPSFYPSQAQLKRPLGPCDLDSHGIRDLYAPPTAKRSSKPVVRLRRTQMKRLTRLLWHENPTGYGGRVARQLAVKYLDEGESVRAAGRDPSAMGEKARALLQAVYEQAPEYERIDEVVAGLGHAALQRCDPVDAQRWFALHVRQHPKGSDRARVLAVLAILETGAGKTAAEALEAARNAPPPKRRKYVAPKPQVVVARADPWGQRAAVPCGLDADGVRDLWHRGGTQLSAKPAAVLERQVKQMERLQRHDVWGKMKLQLRLGLTFLEQAEAQRANGHDPRAAAERARLILRDMYAKYPNFGRLDEVVAGLAHASLLRCDRATAHAWFEMHVRRFAKSSDRARALAVLAAFEMQDD